MESFIFLGIGLVVGALIGWLIASRKSDSSASGADSQDLRVKLASAEATIAGLNGQLAQRAAPKRFGATPLTPKRIARLTLRIFGRFALACLSLNWTIILFGLG